jgi:hypothetical protein
MEHRVQRARFIVCQVELHAIGGRSFRSAARLSSAGRASPWTEEAKSYS